MKKALETPLFFIVVYHETCNCKAFKQVQYIIVLFYCHSEIKNNKLFFLFFSQLRLETKHGIMRFGSITLRSLLMLRACLEIKKEQELYMYSDYHRFLNTAMLLWGCIFCLIAAICLFLGKNYNEERKKWMLRMQLSTAALLGSDAFAWIFRGNPSEIGFYMVRISNFLVFALSDLVLFFFQQYLGCRIFNEEERKQNKWLKAASAIAILGILLVVISQFTGLYYYFDSDNFYHRNPAYIISMVLPLTSMIIDLVLLISYQKKISREIFLAMSTYIIFPVVAALFQMVHYGVSLINLSIGCSMILMYIVASVEQNKEIARLAKSRERIAEKLEIASVLNRCVKELSSEKDDDKAINNLLEIINEYFCSDRTYIFEIDFEKNVLFNTYEYVKDMVTEQIDNLQGVPMEVISVWMENFRQSKPYYISDIEMEKGMPHYDLLKVQDVDCLLAVPLIKDERVTGFLGVDNPRKHYDDATLLSSIQFFINSSLERKAEKEYLKYLSYQDMLTNVYNRNRYMEVLNTYKKQNTANVGVAYIDLNGLKQINDQKGHEAGDNQIKGVASQIRIVFPEQVYRIGGDEFVVVSTEIQEEDFNRRIALLRKQLKKAKISVSVGAVWQEKADDLEAVLKIADMHMYEEKQEYHRKYGTYRR